MSEIKTLEDMRNTVKTIAADCDEEWILECLDAIEAEIAERFIESEPIVRCRDCKFLVPQINDSPLCIRPYENVALWTDFNGFCAWGKRKD